MERIGRRERGGGKSSGNISAGQGRADKYSV